MRTRGRLAILLLAAALLAGALYPRGASIPAVSCLRCASACTLEGCDEVPGTVCCSIVAPAATAPERPEPRQATLATAPTRAGSAGAESASSEAAVGANPAAGTATPDVPPAPAAEPAPTTLALVGVIVDEEGRPIAGARVCWTIGFG